MWSAVTELTGIHAFFGAFLAGMIVPKKGELPQQLAPKIELVVRMLRVQKRPF
jgi:Kef-type K+ transport system membrane component KefB